MERDQFYRGLYLERHELARNVHRAYGLQLTQSLFGHWGATRTWGRIGRPSRARTEWFKTAGEAQRALATKLREKRSRGYAPRSPQGQLNEY